MYVYPLEKLINDDFDFKILNSMQQFWHNTKAFQCIGNPKRQNLLLYVDGCKMTYTDTSGNTFAAKSGDVVYTPIGSEYSVELSDFQSKSSHTVGVNFLLYNKTGSEIKLSEKIMIFRTNASPEISGLFHQSLIYDMVKPYIKSKITFMEILCFLALNSQTNDTKRSIDNILNYISANIDEVPPVSELAKMCGISEVYFRKLFKNHTGMSPVQYRNSIRLNKALTYLEYGNISVQEISDMLGYSTVSHFIKEFRVHYGCSPLKYKKELTGIAKNN